MKLVVDSCILISRIGLLDSWHSEAVEFFAEVSRRRDETYFSVTTYWDLAAAVCHPGEGIGPAKGSLDPNIGQFIRFLHVTAALQDQDLDHQWVAVKGADRVILAVARYNKMPLVTRDRGVLKHAHAFGVTAMSPRDYLDQSPNG